MQSIVVNDNHGTINNNANNTTNIINTDGKDEYILWLVFLLHIKFSVVNNKRKNNNDVVPSTSQKKVLIKYNVYEQ